jgi:hypothetical protein
MEHITDQTQIADLSKIHVPMCYEKYVNKAIASSVKLLTMKEFINITEFNIHAETFDILFMNINDEGMPIYIDDGMLDWMGYSKKENLLKQINRNFEEENDYKILKNTAYKGFLEETPNNIKDLHMAEFKSNFPEPASGASARSIKHLIVMPDAFRSLCMMINTEKGKQIRKYYITLEKLIKAYNLYQTIYRGQEAERAMTCKGNKIDKQSAKLDKQSAKLDEQNMKLDAQNAKLDQQSLDIQKQTLAIQKLLGHADETKTTLDETKAEVVKTNHRLDQAVVDRVVMGTIDNKEQQSLFIYKLYKPYNYEYNYYGFRCQNKSIKQMINSRQNILNKKRASNEKLRLTTSLTFIAKIGHTGYNPNPILFWKEFVKNDPSTFKYYKYCKFDLDISESEFLNILKSKDELRGQNIQELP